MLIERSGLYPYELLKARAGAFGQETGAWVLRLGDTHFTEFKSVTWAQIFKRVKQYGQFLRSLQLKPGDRIGIRGRNGLEWVTLDWAAISCGLITVPIFQQTHPDEVRYILDESEAKILFCDTPVPDQIIDQLCFGDIERAIENMDATFAPSARGPDELATIIYTSGTSGQPKGVMHSLSNIHQAFFTANQWFRLNSRDRLVSYLPLSHVVERMLVEFGTLFTGLQVYFLDKADRLPKELPKIRPTVFISVPRIWELMRNKIERELQAKSEKSLIRYAPEALRRVIIKRVLKRNLGFQATRYFVSGAAKLSSKTAEAFRNWGILIHEAYGLTETLCISSANPPGYERTGTVGKIYSGVEARLADDGEICLKAPFHFLGYYHQPTLTEEVLKEGWFHTGDIGAFDERGYLKITDRKKDLFKTSNGKYIAPLSIELKLKQHPGVRDVIVVGDSKPHCIAVASIDLELISEAKLLEWVDKVNEGLSPHEQVRSVGYVNQVWGVESGEMTPSMKLKRRVILERYHSQIESLFENRSRVRSLEHKMENKVRAHLSV